MSTEGKRPSERLVSLDAYRGFVMLAMASGGGAALAAIPDSPGGLSAADHIRHFLAGQLDHVAWGGCAFWDLIQPSFMFMVGVAMPFSYASRKARGEGWSTMLSHALSRSLILVA